MGLRTVKDAGGTTIVQDPKDALYPDMPRNALQIVDPDFVLPVEKIRSLLPGLIQKPVEEKGMKRVKDKGMKPESKKIKSGRKINKDMGPPSMFVCPECHGPLWELRDGKAALFRCMVGHSYAPRNLFSAQKEELERALWIALRALEERIALQHKLADRAQGHDRSGSGKYFLAKARENSQHVQVIRKILEKL
jgi:two-component system chemotaxis response regulator CheB